MHQNQNQKNRKYEDNQNERSITQRTVVSERNRENEEITKAVKQEKFPEIKGDMNLSNLRDLPNNKKD